MKKLLTIAAALMLTASVAQADITIDLGDLGTVNLATVLIPTAQKVLDRTYPPDVDVDGNPVAKTVAEYTQNLKDYIVLRGWTSFVVQVDRQYWIDNPPAKPDINQYMTLTPAP